MLGPVAETVQRASAEWCGLTAGDLLLTRARAGGKSRVGRNPMGSRNRGTSHHVSEAWERVGGSREIALGGWSQILKGGAGKSRLDLEGNRGLTRFLKQGSTMIRFLFEKDSLQRMG